jgi:hypothetical protein
MGCRGQYLSNYFPFPFLDFVDLNNGKFYVGVCAFVKVQLKVRGWGATTSWEDQVGSGRESRVETRDLTQPGCLERQYSNILAHLPLICRKDGS